MQEKAMKILVGADRYTSCRNIFRETKILILSCIYILEILLIVWKNVKNYDKQFLS